MSPLFGRKHRESTPVYPPMYWQNELARVEGLSMAGRAADLLPKLADQLRKVDDGYPPARAEDLLYPLEIPESLDVPGDVSMEEWQAGFKLNGVLADALQSLVLARLLTPVDSETTRGDSVGYRLSSDGEAALAADDVAAVIIRRLPD